MVAAATPQEHGPHPLFRTSFVLALLLMVTLPVHAQQRAAEVPRLGVLMFMPMSKAAQDDFRQGLQDYGYVEGQNIAVEWRSGLPQSSFGSRSV